MNIKRRINKALQRFGTLLAMTTLAACGGSGSEEETQCPALVAVMNDLHKGRDSGSTWSWVIDISAVLMTLVSATGLVLLLYLKRRRLSGLVTGVVGTIIIVLIYLFAVP